MCFRGWAFKVRPIAVPIQRYSRWESVCLCCDMSDLKRPSSKTKVVVMGKYQQCRFFFLVTSQTSHILNVIHWMWTCYLQCLLMEVETLNLLFRPEILFHQISPLPTCKVLNNHHNFLRVYCIVRPMVPDNNVPCTYHCLHVLSILVNDSQHNVYH